MLNLVMDKENNIENLEMYGNYFTLVEEIIAGLDIIAQRMFIQDKNFAHTVLEGLNHYITEALKNPEVVFTETSNGEQVILSEEGIDLFNSLT